VYLIKTVGIDLAPVSSGLSAFEMRSHSWETRVVDAGVLHISSGAGKQTQFNQQLHAACKAVEFVKKHKPDLIGIEDYTNQFKTHVGFSMGQMGGIVRLLLWQEGYRMLQLTPSRLDKMVMPKGKDNRPAKNKKKQFVTDWLNKAIGVEFSGKAKEVSDMSDATVYALIAACFFSAYWLQHIPDWMNERQREILMAKGPPAGSMLDKKGWQLNGLLDRPYNYLIRNPEREASTYTPEWQKQQENGYVNDVIYVGAGTAECLSSTL